MNTINSADSLRAAIVELEKRQDLERVLLHDYLRDAFEEIKPINLIKNILKDVAASTSIRDNILNTAVGITVGYLGKRAYVGSSKRVYKRLIGNAIMYGITNLVSRNPDIVHSVQKVVVGFVRQGQVSEDPNVESDDTGLF